MVFNHEKAPEEADHKDAATIQVGALGARVLLDTIEACAMIGVMVSASRTILDHRAILCWSFNRIVDWTFGQNLT